MKTILPNQTIPQNIYVGPPESMIEVFSEFLTSYPEIRQTLFSAYESGNMRSLKRVLHYYGPSFIYLGMAEVAGLFENLKLKCSAVENHFSLSKDFAELMQAVEKCWLQTKNEMRNLKKAV